MLFSILFYSITLIIFFYILIKSSNYLVGSSSILGERAGISPFMIGLTIISIGTSLPELFTAIFGMIFSTNGSSFVIGTVIGSNISNSLLILGTLFIFARSSIRIKLSKEDIFYLVTIMIFIIGIFYFKKITFIYGLLFLVLFTIYIITSLKKSSKREIEDEIKENEEGIDDKSNLLLSLILLSSLVGLNIAARGVIYSVENVGLLLNIPLEYLTLTTVAFATSLPELAVTYSAAKQKSYSLAIGNIVGSNISNVLLIIGFSAVFGWLFSIDLFIVKSSYLISIIFFILTTIIIILFSQIKKIKMPKLIGSILLLIYIIYIFLIF